MGIGALTISTSAAPIGVEMGTSALFVWFKTIVKCSYGLDRNRPVYHDMYMVVSWRHKQG